MPRISFLLLVLVSCSRAPAEPAGTTERPGVVSSPASAPDSASPATRSGPASPALAWDAPSRWQRRKPSTALRVAEYLVPRAAGDSDDAECTVFTFGAGQGGSADDNIDRWVKQLAPTTSAPARTTRTVHGMKVSRVEAAGTFTPMQMPGSPTPQGSRPGWRLIGFVVGAPAASWFFKLTGPDATVKAAAKEMDAMIDSARPADPSSGPSP